jgi:hypothetical protein
MDRPLDGSFSPDPCMGTLFAVSSEGTELNSCAAWFWKKERQGCQSRTGNAIELSSASASSEPALGLPKDHSPERSACFWRVSNIAPVLMSCFRY